MDKFTFAPRKEKKVRYDTNKQVYDLIADLYADSIIDFNPDVLKGLDFENTNCEILTVHTTGHIAYANSNLLKSGCAVLCFEEGITSKRNSPMSIDTLSEIIAEKGYYEPGRGTYHNLFDHHGLRRCTSVYDVIESVNNNSLFTALVANDLYHRDSERTGKHFVNLVGIRNGNAIIDDPTVGRIEKYFADFAMASIVIWQW